MDAKLKAKWLEALRSGNFDQTTGQLRYTSMDGQRSYCCLGVLCEIQDVGGVWDGDAFDFNGSWSVTGVPDMLVPLVLELSELEGDFANEGPLPFKSRHGGTLMLSNLNDSGMSFEQIADVIDWAY